ncbi:hypothetical protein BCR42DRAFT_97856 [Absidia repens]|uniref:Uncharacterized protein n=1 Tax=Absidia repens TaxID=90262 RepID=A0A1X2I8X9_9FUNG|nr:hypothetical protein BCR42DRAFT_97856 [Absidia repens]
MGNKFSIVSATSSRTSSSSTKSRNTGKCSRDRSVSVTHIPKHLKPAKPLKKHERERLEKQHFKQQNKGSVHIEGIGIAVPYQPDIMPMNQQYENNNNNNNDKTIVSPPPFAYLQNGMDVVMNIQPEQQHQQQQHQQQQEQQQQQQKSQQNNDECEGNVTTINNGGAKNAFQWFEGRRYQNQDDLILPNDQRELDRLRVLNYILRWAFEG